MAQPVEEYPNTVMSRQPESSHSNGSFGPVFAVLAVIVVISAVACVLGRLCSKRSHRTKEAKNQPSKAAKQRQSLGPKEWESRQKPSFNMRDGDIEFGFDERIPSSKGRQNGGGKAKPPHHNHPQVRFSDNV